MYVTIEEANVTTIDKSREEDPVAVMLTRRGGDVFTLRAAITTDPAREVGRVYEAANGELWFALTDDCIRGIGAYRSAQMSSSALRVLGWDV